MGAEDLLPAGAIRLLALASIQVLGEEMFQNEVIPLYEAICKIEKEEWNNEAHVACLAEACQYRTKQNLINLATFGIDEKNMHFLEYGHASHGIAVRAEAVRRVLDGGKPEYRDLLRKHDYRNGGIPLITYDKEVWNIYKRSI
jgi:hypothetical protein